MDVARRYKRVLLVLSLATLFGGFGSRARVNAEDDWISVWKAESDTNLREPIADPFLRPASWQPTPLGEPSMLRGGYASGEGLSQLPPPPDFDWPDASPSATMSPGSGYLASPTADVSPRRLWVGEFQSLLGMIWDDGVGVYSDWHNLAWIGAFAGGAVAIRESGWDQQVRDFTAKHPDRWGSANDPFNFIGEGYFHVPLIAAFYVYERFDDDPWRRDYSAALASALAITGLSTSAIKLAANTERPTDTRSSGHYGFPSYHTAACFSLAAVTDEYCGPGWGAVAYVTAGMVGWSRIDVREHDLSDIVFGAALGYVVGRSVAGRHRRGDSRAYLLPFRHPVDGSPGLAAHWRF